MLTHSFSTFRVNRILSYEQNKNISQVLFFSDGPMQTGISSTPRTVRWSSSYTACSSLSWSALEPTAKQRPLPMPETLHLLQTPMLEVCVTRLTVDISHSPFQGDAFYQEVLLKKKLCITLLNSLVHIYPSPLHCFLAEDDRFDMKM